MSHFMLLAIVPGSKSDSRQAIEQKLGTMLAPYCEELEVPEYEERCYCVGHQASEMADHQVMQQYGGIEARRDKFWARPDVMALKELQKPYNDSRNDEAETSAEVLKAYKDADAKIDALWKDWIRPLEILRKSVIEDHHMKDVAKHGCDECKGGGKSKSTYNPKSKWDWYVIGGRWTGEFSDYDPLKDPANWEPCTICGGTGTRSDAIAIANGFKPGYCNGCSGDFRHTKQKGVTVKFSFKDYGGDIAPVAQIKRDVVPYALMTPDGEWYAKGKMGWFGMSRDDKSEDDWKDLATKLKEKYRSNHLGVVVDCHI